MNKPHCEAAKRAFYSFVWITEELLYMEGHPFCVQWDKGHILGAGGLWQEMTP